MGLLEVGAKGDARKLLETTFEELAYLVDYLAIIDICAAFESEFSTRLGTACGEATKAVEKNYGLQIFADIRSRLVHKTTDFQGFAELLGLIEGVIPTADFEKLKTLKDIRNFVAHGSVTSGTPKVSPEEAHRLLRSVLESLCPNL